MAALNICVCILFALVAGNLILAEEQDMNSAMNPFTFLSPFFSDSSRSKRAVVTCNYTNANETGTTCRDCRTALRCLPTNVGILRTCRGFLPYCNSGRCSYLPGAECNTTSG